MENAQYLSLYENKDSFKEIESIPSKLITGNPDLIKDARITICIPTYKRPDLLKEAIDSALNQKTAEPYKVLVLDNEDVFDTETQTEKLLKNYNDPKLCYYKNIKNLGMGGNWNRCGQLVKTEYFCLLHDDDLLKDNFIDERLTEIKNKPGTDCFCNANEEFGSQYIPPAGVKQRSKLTNTIKSIIKGKYIKCSHLFPNLVLGNYFGPPTCGITFKTNSFLSSNGFDNSLYPSLDWIFMINFSQRFNVIKSRKALGFYRIEVNESLLKTVQEGFTKQRLQITNFILDNDFKFLKKVIGKDLEYRNSYFNTDFKNCSFIFKKFFRFCTFFYR